MKPIVFNYKDYEKALDRIKNLEIRLRIMESDMQEYISAHEARTKARPRFRDSCHSDKYLAAYNKGWNDAVIEYVGNLNKLKGGEESE